MKNMILFYVIPAFFMLAAAIKDNKQNQSPWYTGAFVAFFPGINFLVLILGLLAVLVTAVDDPAYVIRSWRNRPI